MSIKKRIPNHSKFRPRKTYICIKILNVIEYQYALIDFAVKRCAIYLWGEEEGYAVLIEAHLLLAFIGANFCSHL
jgi:hypothetical protein